MAPNFLQHRCFCLRAKGFEVVFFLGGGVFFLESQGYLAKLACVDRWVFQCLIRWNGKGRFIVMETGI
jgi:hypothetical protein